MTKAECRHGPGGLFEPLMAEIVRIDAMTARERLFEFRLPDGLSLGHRDGQFVEVSIFGVGEAPISVCSPSHQRGTFELTVRSTGSLTDVLHTMKVGDRVGIRGPFGSAFDLDAWKGKDVLIIGGGIGLVPLRSVIKSVLERRADFRDVTILYGTRNPTEILFRDELDEWRKRLDIRFDMTVDAGAPGWTGKVGLITTLIPPLAIDPANVVAAITGPPIMYKFVVQELRMKKVREEDIVVSLERMMKCGVGKCGHCAINGKYCCIDGPVFTLADCRGLPEAL